jgi:hypothetical protein
MSSYIFKKGEGRAVKRCEDLEEEGFWDTSNRCSTCHEDEGYGYFDLLYIEVEGQEHGVCCAARQKLLLLTLEERG